MILASLFASISNLHIENYPNPDMVPVRVRAPSNHDIIDHSPASGSNMNELYKIKNLIQILQSPPPVPPMYSPSNPNQIQKTNDLLLVNNGQTQHLLQNLNSSHFKKFPGDYLWLNSNTIVNKRNLKKFN